MITYNENLLGKMIIAQRENEFEIEIRQGNCLAVFIHKGENEVYLYSFFCDLAHLKRMGKVGKIFSDDVKSLRLNLRYKESQTLAKAFAQNGYEVTCYYE